jgi:hypothetical protein
MKIEVGKTYVIKVQDKNNIELLHEYSKKESFIYNIFPKTIIALKMLFILISIAIPPLLFITILLLKKNKI